jgi:hypothetical protein
MFVSCKGKRQNKKVVQGYPVRPFCFILYRFRLQRQLSIEFPEELICSLHIVLVNVKLEGGTASAGHVGLGDPHPCRCLDFEPAFDVIRFQVRILGFQLIPALAASDEQRLPACTPKGDPSDQEKHCQQHNHPFHDPTPPSLRLSV